jgi:hypothetical protein
VYLCLKLQNVLTRRLQVIHDPGLLFEDPLVLTQHLFYAGLKVFNPQL